jgi:hypothetical protein
MWTVIAIFIYIITYSLTIFIFGFPIDLLWFFGLIPLAASFSIIFDIEDWKRKNGKI